MYMLVPFVLQLFTSSFFSMNLSSKILRFLFPPLMYKVKKSQSKLTCNQTQNLTNRKRKAKTTIATTIIIISITLSLLNFLSLLSLFLPQNSSNLFFSLSTSTFLLSPFSIAPTKIPKLSLPIKCLPSISSILKLTPLTCISPPIFPQHVTFTIQCTIPITVPYKTSNSPVSQCRLTVTGNWLDRLTERLRVGSIIIQLRLKFCSNHSTTSFCSNLIFVSIISFGSRISIHRGEQRNHPLCVSVLISFEKTGLPL